MQLLFFLCLASSSITLPCEKKQQQKRVSLSSKKKRHRIKNVKYENDCRLVKQGLSDIVADAFRLNLNILSWDTFKIISTVFPLYIGMRMVDERIQGNFFCYTHKKNINQPPHWCHEVARFGLGIPIVLLGSQAFLSRDLEFRLAGRMLLLGLPFVIFGKDIIKTFEADCCLRPWHENFCHTKKRALGGFPSGHMAQAFYITMLYGMRFGPKFAIPLGLYSAALAGVFLTCNRHYASQLVAGGALGAIYAFAANRLINTKLSDACQVECKINRKGYPALTMCYAF